jgi:hypothetical protein
LIGLQERVDEALLANALTGIFGALARPGFFMPRVLKLHDSRSNIINQKMTRGRDCVIMTVMLCSPCDRIANDSADDLSSASHTCPKAPIIQKYNITAALQLCGIYSSRPRPKIGP